MRSVLGEEQAYRMVAPVIKDPVNLASLLDIDSDTMRGWYERHLGKTHNPIRTFVERAREYFKHRLEGYKPPGDVNPDVYHRLANWYAATVRPHAPTN